MADGNYVSFKLRAVPTNPGSQLYSLSVPYYATGTASEAGRFHDLAWNGFQGDSSLEFPGIGVQLIDHLDFIPKT
jgi:hypothetical protein